MTEKELQNLFKEKLGQRQFDYNPNNWAAMEAMLDAQGTRKAGFYWWATAAIVVFGVVASLFIYQPKDQTAPTLAAPKQEQYLQQDQTKGISVPPIKENTSTEREATQPIVNQQIEEAAPTAPKQNNLKNNTSSEALTTHQVVAKTPITASADELSNRFETKSNATEGLVVLPALPYSADFYQYAAMDVQYVPQITESTPTSQPIPFHPKALLSNTKGAYLHAGFTLSDSYEDVVFGKGIQVGITYDHPVFRNFGISTGVLYSYNDDIGLAYSKDSVYFRFGREVLRTETNYSSIQSFQVPLEITWAFAPKHRIMAGSYLTYITAVQQDVKQTLYAFKADPDESQEQNNVAGTAFRRYNSGLRFGYQYQPTKLWQIGINLQYGLMDISNSAYDERLNSDHRLIESNIYVRYRLF